MSFSFVFCPLLLIFSSRNELSKASQPKGNFPLGVSVLIFILHFFLIQTHTETHAQTHSSSLAFPVQHHFFLPIVTSHIPAQCSPKHFTTQTCPSTFLGPPVQCGHPMRRQRPHMGAQMVAGDKEPVLPAASCQPSRPVGRAPWRTYVISSEQTPAPVLYIWLCKSHYLLLKHRCGA